MELNTKIIEWQNNKYEVGFIEFLNSDIVREKFIQNIPTNHTPIGMCEAEALCINNENNELVLIEHEVADRIASKVAKNKNAFLKTIAVLEEFFNKCVEDDEYYENEEEAVKIRKKCAQIAGGDIYMNLFIVLLLALKPNKQIKSFALLIGTRQKRHTPY